MTLKVFRDAYLATKFLGNHERSCSACSQASAGWGPPCPKAFPYQRAKDKADRMLGLIPPKEKP